MAAHSLPDDALEAAADATSVSRERVARLVARAADYLRGKERALERRYERALEALDGVVLFADAAFWTRVGDALRFTDAETAAVRGAHEATLLLAGSHADRRAEFESALEIQTAVVLDR